MCLGPRSPVFSCASVVRPHSQLFTGLLGPPRYTILTGEGAPAPTAAPAPELLGGEVGLLVAVSPLEQL